MDSRTLAKASVTAKLFTPCVVCGEALINARRERFAHVPGDYCPDCAIPIWEGMIERLGAWLDGPEAHLPLKAGCVSLAPGRFGEPVSLDLAPPSVHCAACGLVLSLASPLAHWDERWGDHWDGDEVFCVGCAS